MQKYLALAVDWCLISLATLSALYLRENFDPAPHAVSALIPYLLLTLFVWALTLFLPFSGVHRTDWRTSNVDDYFRLLRASVAVVLASVAFGFAAGWMTRLPRSFPVIQCLLMILFLPSARIGLRLLHQQRRKEFVAHEIASKRSKRQRPTAIIVGMNRTADLFLKSINEFGQGKFRVAGVISRKDCHVGRQFRSFPVLGTPEHVNSVINTLSIHGVQIDCIIVALPRHKLSARALDAFERAEQAQNARIIFMSDQLHSLLPGGPGATSDARLRLGSTEVLPYVERSCELEAALHRPYWARKRIVDIIIASIAIIVALPLMILVYLFNIFMFGFPVVFWQERPGLNGVPFVLYKFRSLHDALDGAGQILPKEARETAYGRVLRSLRLDELPQLFSILAGHMSFIGPRPLLLEDQLDEFANRLLVRPGLTGWAQVNGGNCIGTVEKMALDLWYIRNASMRVDLEIIARTIGVLFKGEHKCVSSIEMAMQDLVAYK